MKTQQANCNYDTIIVTQPVSCMGVCTLCLF